MQKREHTTLHTLADQIECDLGLLYAQVDRTKQRVFEKARAALQQQCARAERAERTARAATCAGDAAVQAVLERVASEKAAAMADEADYRLDVMGCPLSVAPVLEQAPELKRALRWTPPDWSGAR